MRACAALGNDRASVVAVRHRRARRDDAADARPLGAAEPTLPIPVLVCQQTIGNEALRFVTRVHGAERRCRDDRARGLGCLHPDGCDEARRDDAVATARLKLTRLYESRCGAIALTDLGFPAACDDADGPPFTVTELRDCIDGSHRAAVAVAIAAAYPEEPDRRSRATRSPASAASAPPPSASSRSVSAPVRAAGTTS